MFVLQLTLLLPIIIYGFLHLMWAFMRSKLLKRHSGLIELEKIAEGSPSKQKRKGTVVICGGSIAGLLTARVCHDFFERVIIVEPEEWLTSEDGFRRFSWEQEHKRTRVMQYRSLHGSQAFLYYGLQKLFPDLEEQCIYSGLTIFPHNLYTTFGGLPTPLPANEHLRKNVLCSRQALETFVRRLVLGRGNYPRIEQISGTAIGIIPSPTDPSRIDKIKIRGADSQIQDINASLVVGVTRAGARWLSQAGYGTAETYEEGKLPLRDAKIAFDQKLQYTTLIFKIAPSTWDKIPVPTGQTSETLSYIFAEDQPEKGRRLFVMFRLEGGQFVMFLGQSRDESIKYESLDEVRAYLYDLVLYDPKYPVPEWVFQLIDILDETNTPVNYAHVRIPPTAYIRYHQVANLPSNFAAVGDSVLSVDPVFGQGCTKAMLGAVALHATLLQQGASESQVLPPDFSVAFFKEHFDKTDNIWQGTLIQDYGIPCTEPLPGDDLRKGKLVRSYVRQLRILATKDEQARRALYDAGAGFGSPIDIFHPLLAVKILLNALTGA